VGLVAVELVVSGGLGDGLGLQARSLQGHRGDLPFGAVGPTYPRGPLNLSTRGTVRYTSFQWLAATRPTVLGWRGQRRGTELTVMRSCGI
jgi:hypothetical protein